jgi:hypothetical protein
MEVGMDGHVGDHVVVEGAKVGQTRRTGEIVEVLGNHYRVRWDDGHQTTFFPSSDARIEPVRTAG